jgi:hypothetical protein
MIGAAFVLIFPKPVTYNRILYKLTMSKHKNEKLEFVPLVKDEL